jgi:NADH-quinone oxidoreductase subunit A
LGSQADYGLALWPLVVYLLVVAIVAAGMVALSYLLGGRRREPATDLPYESGVRPTGSARLSHAADFYLVAVLFVIFDLESVFL